MSAIADRVARSSGFPSTRSAAFRLPIWSLVLGSRVLVLFAGTWGALFAPQVAGWQRLDPQSISSSMGSLGNVLGAAAVRWDAISYINLSQHGYTSGHSTVYFPLYPMLISALTPVTGSPVVAGVLVSLVALAIGLELIHRLTRWQLGTKVADTTVLLLAFAPFSFVFSAVYPAALLLACAAGTFYLARQERFVLASVVAACGAVTHIDGILLIAPLALMYWNSRGRPHSLRELWSPQLPALALPAASLAGFFIYLHALGYGWLAPIANQNMANTGRTLLGPPLTVLDSLRDTFVELDQSLHGTNLALGGVFPPAAQNVFYLVALGLAVLAVHSVWRRLPMEYALFGLLAIIVCTSSAVSMEPLKGFDRYMLPIFPLTIGAAAWLEHRRLTTIALTASAVLLVFYTIEFTRWVSVF